jgi:hypothetical protein
MNRKNNLSRHLSLSKYVGGFIFSAMAVSAVPGIAQAQTLVTIPESNSSISWTNVGGAGSPTPENSPFINVREESRLIDGSGLSSGTYLEHSVGDNYVNSNLTQQTGGLLIDLGATFQLGIMQIWSLNDSGVFGNFSPETFNLYASNDSNAVTVADGQIQVSNLSKFTMISRESLI